MVPKRVTSLDCHLQRSKKKAISTRNRNLRFERRQAKPQKLISHLVNYVNESDTRIRIASVLMSLSRYYGTNRRGLHLSLMFNFNLPTKSTRKRQIADVHKT